MYTTIVLCDAETRQILGIQVVDVSEPYNDDFQEELESRGLDWYEYYPE